MIPVLLQLKPIASKNDTVTVHVPNGAPGGTDPIQVTHRQMQAVKNDFLSGKDQGRKAEALLMAYAKATRAA